ncbi:MAG: DUF1080 domain-containing protein [Bacteroidales bacterium]
MKTQLIFLFGFALLLTQCGNNKEQTNVVSDNDTQWTWLFDGSSTEEWRGTKSEEFPKQGWVVNNGVLTVLGKTDEQAGGRDIITKKRYGNFELELEVKLSEGANSGIKYQVTDSFPGKKGSFLGLEYQLLDNERHPDAHEGRDGNHKMASLYDIMPPKEDLTIHPPGEWNKVRIVLDGNMIEHWLNDEKVLEIDRKGHTFRELVSLSKYDDLENFGELDNGHILLQGHGNDVSFRNIKIRTW